MSEMLTEFDPDKDDASFDLDGTVFKYNVLEAYTQWCAKEQVFQPIPEEVQYYKRLYKVLNTEKSYKHYLGTLVLFFVDQVENKSVTHLTEAAKVVARQQVHRQWNVTTAIMRELGENHNLIAASLLPEWLMHPFITDLGFNAVIGSTYVSEDGVFTGQAFTTDKVTDYCRHLRDGDNTKLAYHMGDTSGDNQLFAIAHRPILFNPSWTLFTEHTFDKPTIIKSDKDTATVLNPTNHSEAYRADFFGAPFDARKILDLVAAVDHE